MAYSALPIVAEAYVNIRDLKTGVYICFAYFLLANMLFYGAICSSNACTKSNGLIIAYRVISTILSMIASVALILGTIYKNWRFLRTSVVIAMFAFTIDVFGGFYAFYVTMANLQKCTFSGWLLATIGIILPLVMLYNIIIVHSFRTEVQFILRKPKDQELHVAYY